MSSCYKVLTYARPRKSLLTLAFKILRTDGLMDAQFATRGLATSAHCVARVLLERSTCAPFKLPPSAFTKHLRYKELHGVRLQSRPIFREPKTRRRNATFFWRTCVIALKCGH
jgi:hypothetical protein